MLVDVPYCIYSLNCSGGLYPSSGPIDSLLVARILSIQQTMHSTVGLSDLYGVGQAISRKADTGNHAPMWQWVMVKLYKH